VHALAQFDPLSATARDNWDPMCPQAGNLERDLLGALCDILELHTSTPGRCWFCLWDGYGWLRPGACRRHFDLGRAGKIGRAHV